MTHRIILFRGMNTGGVRAPVGEQRAMAEAMGLKNPRTLQASGNLVVESGKATAALEADIEKEMERRFGLKVAAMVRTPEQWAKLVAANPFPNEAAVHPSRVVAMVMKDGIKDGAGGGSGPVSRRRAGRGRRQRPLFLVPQRPGRVRDFQKGHAAHAGHGHRP
jgi:uncharacterized protein (DUF1697 family)